MEYSGAPLREDAGAALEMGAAPLALVTVDGSGGCIEEEGLTVLGKPNGCKCADDGGCAGTRSGVACGDIPCDGGGIPPATGMYGGAARFNDATAAEALSELKESRDEGVAFKAPVPEDGVFDSAIIGTPPIDEE